MYVRDYPLNHLYHDIFENIRVFIEKLNKSRQSINYHWSRWEWYIARSDASISDLENIRIYYNDRDEIIGVLMLEDKKDVYYYVSNDIEVKDDILSYILDTPMAKLMIEDNDFEMLEMVKDTSLIKTNYIEHMARFTKAHITFDLPNDFILHDLSETYDVRKHHLCLWKGFNNKDKISYDDESLHLRKRQISSPHFKKSFAYVIENNNQYVAYSSIWYEQGTDIAMIEPVCTIPEYRRKGLATATISKCIEAVKKNGAKEIIVGSNQDFYKALGFEVFNTATVYKKS